MYIFCFKASNFKTFHQLHSLLDLHTYVSRKALHKYKHSFKARNFKTFHQKPSLSHRCTTYVQTVMRIETQKETFFSVERALPIEDVWCCGLNAEYMTCRSTWWDPGGPVGGPDWSEPVLDPGLWPDIPIFPETQ
jgi:hypothetical protein